MTNVRDAKVLLGPAGELPASLEQWESLPVDMSWPAPPDWQPPRLETTLRDSFRVTGPGTYAKHSHSTLIFEPCPRDGWWIDRSDLVEQLPIHVSLRNVWTTARNIVLRSGNPHNYLRMVEHIIAFKLGMGIDNAMIHIETGDPPLFNVGSLPILEAVERAGLETIPDRPIRYLTVKEPVCVIGPNGSFLHVTPAEPGRKVLSFDVAIDFPTAIGKQRIQFDLFPETFRHGAHARTNCSLMDVMFAKTIGKLLADVRHLGYTRENILIAGKQRYHNEPQLLHEGKSLEAVWHRAVLDLVAALSLIDTGRLVGHVTSYKAGHTLDVRLVLQLYLNDLLEPAG